MYNNCKVKSTCYDKGTIYTLVQSQDNPYMYKCTWTATDDPDYTETDYSYGEDYITGNLEKGVWVVVEDEEKETMKVQIITSTHEYQGLYYNTIIENARYVEDGNKDRIEFTHNGKRWILDREDVVFVHDGVKTTKQPDAVNSPKHYAVFEQLEAIEVIASSMTIEQFYGYCLGNILKYRLRAGGKDDVMQELGKADRYQGLYNEFKHLCKAT